MEGCSDDVLAPRKKVRKGVHSCRECRRRKVRCIFASARDVVCITCTRRGSRCLSQSDSANACSDGTADTNSNSNAALLENDIGRGASPNDSLRPKTLNTSSSSSWHGNNMGVWHTLQSPISSSNNTTPSNNATQTSPTKVNTTSAVREALLISLPSVTDLGILLGNTKNNSRLCSESKSSALNESAKESISTKSLLNPELQPVLLARQMLLLATSLQHISPLTVLPGLSKCHQDIVQGLAESAITLVNNNDALLGTLEGLDNMILEGYFHIDCGNLRRAWLTMRRAVTVAQLLGLHRSGVHLFKVIDQQSNLDYEAMWSSIVTMERVLSLLLGLPTSAGAVHTVPIVAQATDGSDLLVILGNWTARILDRNQMSSSQEALELTRQIDEDIIKVSQQMPSSFWQSPAFEGLETDSPAALRESKRAFNHMCYYILVIQLHLPHMLCPSHAPQRTYSKIACVNASREILFREISLRSLNPVSACCRISDFLALIAGMTLILAHAVGHCGKDTMNVLAHQRLADRGTVKRTLECLRSMSELHQDVLAVRCVDLLGDLLTIEEDAARGSNHHTSQQSQVGVTNYSGRKVLIIRVPYLGAIQISHNGISNVGPLGSKQVSSFGEGVTIGGIGSLHVKSPVTPEDDTSEKRAALTAEVQADNMVSIWAPSASYIHNDEILPDAAAGLDDWVFQGLDTAFFDSLMHEGADSVPCGVT